MDGNYPLLFTIGAIGALLWLSLAAPGRRDNQEQAGSLRAMDAGITALLVGLIGARLAHVIAVWPTYAPHPLDSLRFWDGGLAWSGGVIGALLGMLLATRRLPPFLHLADRMAMPATFLAFVCWFACLLDRCAYGLPADHGWLTPVAADVFGVRSPRWPVQALGAIYSLLSLALLQRIRLKLSRPGTLGSLALMLISAGNLLLSFVRGDSTPALGSLRLDGVAAAVLLAISAMAFLSRIIPPTDKKALA